ncbi:MAG: hypothetical protein KDE22_18095 [Rhodobacterales bacterium]|nr:hypothetical protein [Rhodobacterales bacterium]
MTSPSDKVARHLRITAPSPWMARFAPLVRPGGTVLDLACGGGRHARHFLDRGCKAVLIDRVTEAVQDLAGHPDAQVMTHDLESGPSAFAPGGPLAGRAFDAVLVCNYLHRPLFPDLMAAVAPGGLFLYETFARGNEDFTRPRNPDHLLRAGELLSLLGPDFQVVAYEHGVQYRSPTPGVIQHVCAVKDAAVSTREDGEPRAHPVHPGEGPA